MRSPAWLIREGDFEYVTIYVLWELTRNIDFFEILTYDR